MSRDLHIQVERFRHELENAQKLRRQERLQQARDLEQGKLPSTQLKTFTPSADVLSLLGDIQRQVAVDIQRYAIGDAAIVKDGPPPAPGVHTQSVRQQFSNFLIGVQPGIALAGLPSGIAVLITMLEQELAAATGESGLQNPMSAAVIPKLKLVQQALQSQRYSDCLTVLKTIQRGDPHNVLVLFLLSQLLYFLAGQGQQGSLPEARDYAQRSIIHTDKIPSEKLWQFRYQAIVSERMNDPDKALAWLRDTGMLSPKLMGDDWGRKDGAGLKGWAILATIPVKHWSEAEFNTLLDMVRDIPGGALLYLMWFRQGILEDAAERKTPVASVETMENMVQMAWGLYRTVGVPLKELALKPRQMTWTVRLRYAHTLARLAPPPEFDHVLLHVALNGEAWRRGYPDQDLRAATEDSTPSYWRLWAVSLTPVREQRQNHLLPAQESLDDLPILELAEALLEKIRAAEQERIKSEVWEDLKPWMVRWSMDHLLAAGSGSNQPRLRFAPTLPPYSQLYRTWSEPAPQDTLASTMIAENAARGAFASLFEAVAAFEGAARLLDDPTHGLVAAQRRALAAARKQNPAKFGGVTIEAATGKLVLLLVPMVVVGLVTAIFMVADNVGQAIGLVLALGGVTGVLMVRYLR